MNYLFIYFIFLLILFLFYFYDLESFKNFSKKNANLLFLKNNNKHIYNVNILKKKSDINDCFKKCNFNDCIKLKKMKENYNKCFKCQNNDNKCFNNLNTGGICESCGDNLKKFDCNDLNYYACPDLHNVFSKNSSEPYYLEINNDNNITSPYKQACLFCWNLKSFF